MGLGWTYTRSNEPQYNELEVTSGLIQNRINSNSTPNHSGRKGVLALKINEFWESDAN